MRMSSFMGMTLMIMSSCQGHGYQLSVISFQLRGFHLTKPSCYR